MKKSIIYIAALMTAAMGFTSCDDDFEQAPIADFIPVATLEANTTLRELKEAFYEEKTAYSVLIGTKENGDHYVVKGRVVSVDETANFYKKIAIEDATGGLIFSVNMNKMYETYKFGQEIVVDVTGLYFGTYSGCVQLGGYAAPTDGPSRMVKSIWQERAEVNGLPDAAAVDTLEITIPELNDLRADIDNVADIQGKLIRVNGLKFQNPGEQLGSTSFNNSRTLSDKDGNRIVLNTCGYGTLWSTRAPSGEGDVVGIITNYTNNSGTSSWQLYLNDLTGLIGFTPFGAETVDPVGAFTVDFENGFPEGWYHFALQGNKDWRTTEFSNNTYAAMTGYQGTAPFDAWLVSQPIDASMMTDKILTFETQVNGYGSTTTEFEVYILDNVEPDKANKVKLDCTLAQPVSSGYSPWASSGNVSLAAATGKFFIGWRYYATQDANYATWCVDNITVK